MLARLLKLAYAATHSQKLYLVVRPLELLLKTFDCSLLLHYLLQFRIHIDRWGVADLGSSGRIVERRNIFLRVKVDRSQTGYHQGEAVSTETLLEDRCQFGLPVRDVVHHAFPSRCGRRRGPTHLSRAVFCESRDDLTESEQGLVDFDRLLELLWVLHLIRIRSVRLSLATRQVHQLQLAEDLS